MTSTAVRPSAVIDRIGTDVHVWVREVEPDADPVALDGTELDRADRFVRTADRDSYVTAHRLLRQSLTWARPGIAPEEWTFGVTEYERPILTGPEAAPCFSLSHTSRRVAVAIAQTDCGVDVECGERVRDLEFIARTVLTDSELARFLARSTEIERRRFFFRIWTLKESYTKARGLGLRVPFDEIEFGLDPITVVDRTIAQNEGTNWRFEQWYDADIPVAVAFRCELGTTTRRVIRHGRRATRTSARSTTTEE